jgi:hypothetical protein
MKMKDSFYEELEPVFDKLPTYHMKILLGYFNAKVGREDIFKPINWNESLNEIRTDNAESVGYFELKKHKLWFDEGCSKLLDQRKQLNCRGYRIQVK